MSPRWSRFPRYVTVADRRARAEAAAARLGKGKGLDPVAISGRQVATTFWGKAWCQNLESYSDFATRLPRGRSYLRSGAVVDLKIAAGEIRARVAGTSLYTVEVSIRPVAARAWQEIVTACAGRVDSMLALLEGRIPDQVLRLVTDPGRGLFPEPRHIDLDCSCPDSATMCKHLAAVLYGVGARLDQRPELLFTLRGVEPTELVHQAASAIGAAARAPALEGQSLEELFGIELAPEGKPPVRRGRKKPAPRRRRGK
jgi:uncharacterized Zn finger protein